MQATFTRNHTMTPTMREIRYANHLFFDCVRMYGAIPACTDW